MEEGRVWGLMPHSSLLSPIFFVIISPLFMENKAYKLCSLICLLTHDYLLKIYILYKHSLGNENTKESGRRDSCIYGKY